MNKMKEWKSYFSKKEKLLMVLFSMLYGMISYTCSYYGEMVTYLGMTMPMAVFALLSWLKNPYDGNRSEVEVNRISRFECIGMGGLAIVVTAAFYFILDFFQTANMIPSTISVTTSFAAFFVNDLYGFLSWKKMEKRQMGV